MQKILDIAYSNVSCIEAILRDVFALVIGYVVPVLVFLFCLLIVVSFFFYWAEAILDNMIARKRRIEKKTALLDNGDKS